MARSHDVSDAHGRFSVKMASNFFPLLNKKRWSKAEHLLDIELEEIEQDEWINGYVHALSGMISALKGSYSAPQPYIVDLTDFNEKKLKEVKNSFSNLSSTLLHKKEFDAGYFQAWEDFIQYVIHSYD